MKRTQQFVISVPIIPGVSKARMKSYIADAVSSWSGQFEPPCEQNNYEGDPMFGAFVGPSPRYRSKVTVHNIKKY